MIRVISAVDAKVKMADVVRMLTRVKAVIAARMGRLEACQEIPILVPFMMVTFGASVISMPDAGVMTVAVTIVVVSAVVTMEAEEIVIVEADVAVGKTPISPRRKKKEIMTVLIPVIITPSLLTKRTTF